MKKEVFLVHSLSSVFFFEIVYFFLNLLILAFFLRRESLIILFFFPILSPHNPVVGPVRPQTQLKAQFVFHEDRGYCQSNKPIESATLVITIPVGNKMVDYGVNNNAQGAAIPRPAAQPTLKESSSFNVQRANRGIDGYGQQQQITLSARGVPEGSSFAVGPQISSDGSGRGNLGSRTGYPKESPRFQSPGIRNPTEFSPHLKSDGIPRAPGEEFLVSNQGSNRESDRAGEKLSSPVGSNMPNFLGMGSPPGIGAVRAEYTDSGIHKIPSGSVAEDNALGQPSYQRYTPGSVLVKGAGSLAAKKGARREELTVGKGRFLMKTQIGAGSFGEIYWGIDTISNKEVAIKLESVKVRHPQLLYESRIYKLLHTKETNFHPSITRYNKNTFFTTNKVVPTRGGAFVESLRSGQKVDGDNTPHSGRGKGLGPATFQELREVVGFPRCYFYGIRGAPDPQAKNVRISEKKMNTRPEILCRDEPPQILKFITYARGLKFEETPDYTSCREFFASIMDRHNWERDWIFDWVIRRQGERQREHQTQHSYPLADGPNGPLLGNRLPMLNGYGAPQTNMNNNPNGVQPGSPAGYSDKNSNPYNMNSPTELSAMLSTVDGDGGDRFSEMGGNKHQHNPGQGHIRNNVWEQMRSNKVHMQPNDLPGDMEFML
eukprot:gene7861-5488_t